MRKKALLKRLGGTALAVSMMLTMTGCPLSFIVSFADPGLEAAVRQELGQPIGFVNRLDILRLRSLDAKGLSIRNLSGLEFATGLSFLDLSNNPVSDITPLTNLNNLKTLNLDQTSVFDLAPLAGLTQLNSLSVCGAAVTDIQALVTNAVVGGLGPGDFVNLQCDLLSNAAETVQVPSLQAFGVNVACCEEDS
ncbi:MAG: hypothetical protein AMXMBFR84_48950 [Candidatus Hydrogenedentota bacterium]